MHQGEVNEPQKALCGPAVRIIALTRGTNPIELPREDDSVSRGELPQSRHKSIENRKDVLVYDMLPRHEQLVHKELNEDANDWQYECKDERRVAETHL